MLNFNDWCKKDKKEKGHTLTKSSSDLPLQKDEPVKRKETIPQIVADVADFISSHNN